MQRPPTPSLRPTAAFVGALTATLCTAAAAGAGPLIYTVDSTLDSLLLDVCSEALAGDCSLRGAIERANSDGTDSRIVLGDAVYRLTRIGADEDGNQTGDLDALGDGDLEIVAAAGAHPVIEQATDDRILDTDLAGGFSLVVTGPMTLRGGSITVGQAPYGGLLQLGVGAVGLQTVELSDLRLEQGHADGLGGCLLVNADDVQFDGVEIDGCSAQTGGGAFVAADNFSAVESRFLGNLAQPTPLTDAPQSGGGLLLQLSMAGTATILDSIFRGNRVADGVGGGLRGSEGTLEIHRTEFSDNRVGGPGALLAAGGGLSVGDATLALENVTFSRNSIEATHRVGIGLHATFTPTDLRFVTVVEPAASAQFGNAAVFFSSSAANLDHSILAGGCDASEDSPATTSEGGNIFETDGTLSTCGLSGPDDQVVADAGLLRLAPNGSERRTHALTDTSPALDQGSFFDTGCPTSDQRGATRALFSPCDSGAHEVDPEQQPPIVHLFADGWESGDTSAWSAASP